jgi:hypothetical protein
VLLVNDLRGPLSGLYVDVDEENIGTLLSEQDARLETDATEKSDETLALKI